MAMKHHHTPSTPSRGSSTTSNRHTTPTKMPPLNTPPLTNTPPREAWNQRQQRRKRKKKSLRAKTQQRLMIACASLLLMLVLVVVHVELSLLSATTKPNTAKGAGGRLRSQRKVAAISAAGLDATKRRSMLDAHSDREQQLQQDYKRVKREKNQDSHAHADVHDTRPADHGTEKEFHKKAELEHHAEAAVKEKRLAKEDLKEEDLAAVPHASKAHTKKNANRSNKKAPTIDHHSSKNLDTKMLLSRAKKESDKPALVANDKLLHDGEKNHKQELTTQQKQQQPQQQSNVENDKKPATTTKQPIVIPTTTTATDKVEKALDIKQAEQEPPVVAAGDETVADARQLEKEKIVSKKPATNTTKGYGKDNKASISSEQKSGAQREEATPVFANKKAPKDSKKEETTPTPTKKKTKGAVIVDSSKKTSTAKTDPPAITAAKEDKKDDVETTKDMHGKGKAEAPTADHLKLTKIANEQIKEAALAVRADATVVGDMKESAATKGNNNKLGGKPAGSDAGVVGVAEGLPKEEEIVSNNKNDENKQPDEKKSVVDESDIKKTAVDDHNKKTAPKNYDKQSDAAKKPAEDEAKTATKNNLANEKADASTAAWQQKREFKLKPTETEKEETKKKEEAAIVSEGHKQKHDEVRVSVEKKKNQEEEKDTEDKTKKADQEAKARLVEAAKEHNLESYQAVAQTEEHPELSKAVAKALEEAHSHPVAKTANFCGGKPKVASSTLSPIAPAVIILGMEDTSTELLWHVLSQINPKGSVSEPSGHQPLPPVKYESLNDMNPAVEDGFWIATAKRSNGHWVSDVFCAQQVGHNHTLLGFPWLTLGNVAENSKATETLKTVSKYPENSISVIRYRRNLLDTVARQEQHLLEIKNGQPVRGVKLDHKKLLKDLTHRKTQQDALDKFLVDTKIPHIVIDHETLFPFNDWKDLVNVTKLLVEEFPVPLNVKLELGRVPPDQRPPEQSSLEQEWAKLLQSLHITKPTSLHDIFLAAHSFDRRDSVFWTQQHSLTNYAAIEQDLKGTRFQAMLRNLEYTHDFYGCACNDKDANKKKLWKGWKDHTKKQKEL